MDHSLPNILNRPPKQCHNCRFWDSVKIAPEGYVQAKCKQPTDERDQKWKRGSDTCGNWATKI